MAFCLLPSKVEDFKRALKDHSIDIGDLVKMSTADRTAALKEYAGANAKDVNTLFEEKLVLKNKMMGLRNWASKMGELGRYSEEGKASIAQSLADYQAAQQERTFSPKQDEAFLNDLADKRVGVHVSKDVAAKVFELASKADALKNVDPKMSGVGDDYLLARNALNDYVASQTPISPVGSIAKNLVVIARNHLLMNPATPLKTTVGQIVNSTMDLITRRLGTFSAGVGNHALVSQANKEAWATFRKTGVNTASVEGGRLGDNGLGRLGEGTGFNVSTGRDSGSPLADTVAKGVRGYAKLTNKIAIDWEHNFTFTKFYQKAFFDGANVFADAMAKQTGKSSADIFSDAVRVDPQTPEGEAVRSTAQQQAARVTSTNDTPIARAAMGVKNAFNKWLPGSGDLLMPIAKIPANILWNGIENAGLGIPLGIRDIARGRLDMQSADLATRYQGMVTFGRGVQTVGRTIGVLSAAAFFTSQLQKSDFRTDNYGNHFVKIGSLWINMEYVSAMSPALAGMMEWKAKGAHGQSVGADIGQYATGAVSGYKNLPGIDNFLNINVPTLLASRAWPVFVNSLLSGRPMERLFFGSTGVETTDEVAQDNRAKAVKAAATRQAAQ